MHNNGKDHLDKFDAKVDEALFIGYSSTSKAHRVYNKRTLRIEESIHVIFDESLSSVVRKNNLDEQDESWMKLVDGDIQQEPKEGKESFEDHEDQSDSLPIYKPAEK